jgi:hypothetical protein
MTEMNLGDDGKITGIRGPWHEVYTKTDSSPKVGFAPEVLKQEMAAENSEGDIAQGCEHDVAGHSYEEWNNLIKSMSASEFKK